MGVDQGLRRGCASLLFRQSRLLGQHFARRLFNRRLSGRWRIAQPLYGQRLGLEALEDRRLLAVFSVSNLSDSGTGSLRDAIATANSTPGADEVQFAVVGTIALTSGELDVTETLTITGPGQGSLIIDAQQNSRLFDNSSADANFTISGLTLTGGRTTDSGVEGQGGAIRSLGLGRVTIENSTITGNGTSSSFADGGAILAGGDVVVTNSTVTGNSTAGIFARGGAIYAYGSVTVTQSTISGNSTVGNNAHGGGISSTGDVTVTDSTLSGNSTAGSFSGGGAVLSIGHLTLIGSTVSGNSTAGSFTYGGGIASVGELTTSHSTITDNHASDPSANGGGIWNFDDPVQITNSIVAGNSAGNGIDDINPGTGSLTIDFSLIGVADGLSILSNMGNQAGTSAMPLDPLLAALANNGGPTETHSLLAGSPAIDAGGSLTVPPDFDQRGAPYVRLFDDPTAPGSGIDIGALELQPTSSADFDEDGDVDGADFLAWQRGFGTPTPSAIRSDGDADNDLDVDGNDLGIFEAAFGSGVAPLTAQATLELLAVGSPQRSALAMPSAKSVAATDLTDSALAASWFETAWLDTGGEEAAASLAETDMVNAGSAASNVTDGQTATPDATRAMKSSLVHPQEASATAANSNETWLTDELLQRIFG